AAISHGQVRLHEQQWHYAQALEAYQLVLQGLDAHHDLHSFPTRRSSDLNVYRAQQDLEQALSYYQQAAAFKERGGKPGDLVTSLHAQAARQKALQQEQEYLHVCQRRRYLLRAMPAPTDCRQLVAVLVLLG